MRGTTRSSPDSSQSLFHKECCKWHCYAMWYSSDRSQTESDRPDALIANRCTVCFVQTVGGQDRKSLVFEMQMSRIFCPFFKSLHQINCSHALLQNLSSSKKNHWRFRNQDVLLGKTCSTESCKVTAVTAFQPPSVWACFALFGPQ